MTRNVVPEDLAAFPVCRAQLESPERQNQHSRQERFTITPLSQPLPSSPVDQGTTVRLTFTGVITMGGISYTELRFILEDPGAYSCSIAVFFLRDNFEEPPPPTNIRLTHPILTPKCYYVPKARLFPTEIPVIYVTCSVQTYMLRRVTSTQPSTSKDLMEENSMRRFPHTK